MHKTVWTGSRYDAGSHGKRLIKALGVEFDYPKSLYTMRDVLFACVGDKRDAVILDYLGGSGTTLHATCLLNAEDGGSRQCLLVTNNEVAAKTADRLHRSRRFTNDPEYEQHGVFESVTLPRCTAAITGKLPSGEPIPGEYIGGRPRRAGFEENCAFFRLDYLDADDVELRRRLTELNPLFWLRSGSRGPLPRLKADSQAFAVIEDCGYAILFDETALREFVVALNSAPDVRRVFLTTDSEDAFAEMASELGPGRNAEMLYRDYVRFFRTFILRLSAL